LAGRAVAGAVLAVLVRPTVVAAAAAVVRIAERVHALAGATALTVGAAAVECSALVLRGQAYLAPGTARSVTFDAVRGAVSSDGAPGVGRRHRDAADERRATRLERLAARHSARESARDRVKSAFEDPTHPDHPV
jgi:hypothetical protein